MCNTYRIVARLLLALMLSSNVSFAQQVSFPQSPHVAGEPDVGEAISPMKKGDKAPFSGVLLSPKALAKVTVDLQHIGDQVSLEVDKSTKTCEANCKFKIETVKIELETDKKILVAKLDAEKKENKILTQRITKLEKEKPNTMLWGAGGFLAGVVATIAIIFGVNKAQSSSTAH